MELRWYQQEAVDACWSAIKERKAHPCIVAPTGAGKSVVIAEICRQALTRWDGRTVVLAHRKELLEQNAAKIQSLLPDVEVGIYSAGLGRRETDTPVLLGGIQSIYKRAFEIGGRQLAIVDEAHLISPDGGSMYRTFLDELMLVNPRLRVIGLTATPYRTGEGEVTEGDDAFLTEICYETPVARLIEEGYLSKLVTSATTQVSMAGVAIRGGEFVQKDMGERFMAEGMVANAVSEMVSRAAGRRSCLVFGATVEHAYAVWSELRASDCGRVEIVTGKTDAEIRRRVLDRFRAGEVRWLVNVDVLTTGFDAPNIDCLAILRATQSPGLFAQMVGRGFRTCEGKDDCLVLDFGGNLLRHGPLDDPYYGRVGGHRSGGGEAPMKECPSCQQMVYSVVTVCEHCGHEFAGEGRQVEHEELPEENAPILLGGVAPAKLPKPVAEWLSVDQVRMRVWPAKESKPETLRVDYYCSRSAKDMIGVTISEWVCLRHDGYARTKARQWWAEHSDAELPRAISEAIEAWHLGKLRMPCRLLAVQDGRFFKIKDREFEDERPTPDMWHQEVTSTPFDEEE